MVIGEIFHVSPCCTVFTCKFLTPQALKTQMEASQQRGEVGEEGKRRKGGEGGGGAGREDGGEKG